MTGIEKQADTLLANLRIQQRHADVLSAEYEAQLAQLKERYDGLMKPITETLVADEKSLLRLMKKHRAELFDGRDKKTLPNGILLCGEKDRVVVPRDAVEQCERHKFFDAVKIAKSIDRAALELWPDEKLVLIGAERKPVTVFEYELNKSTEG